LERVFASFVLGSEVVRQIMRWDMAVLQESPWYQQILREGEQKGRQEEGRSLILKQLTRQIGALPPALTTQIQSLTLEQLEALGEALLDFSTLVDLETWLAGHL
jgi:predicted transposase YdaD